jgi:hypothetical protein
MASVPATLMPTPETELPSPKFIVTGLFPRAVTDDDVVTGAICDEITAPAGILDDPREL